MKLNDKERLKIYSGIFEVKRQTLELPIMTLDMSIIAQQKTINGIATITHDLGCGNIIKSKFRSTSHNFSILNDGSFLINCTGYPVEKKVGLPSLNDYCEEDTLNMNLELPNLKMMLRLDKSCRTGTATYKFRTHCTKKWIDMVKVPIFVNQDGLKKVA